MRIDKVDIFRYALPLTRPLNLMGIETHERRGLLIRLRNTAGTISYGEIAPFPGLHQESLPAALEQMTQFSEKMRGHVLTMEFARLNGAFESWLAHAQLYPSVRFGVEMAVLHILAKEMECPLSQMIAPEAPDTVPVNGLLAGGLSEMRSQLIRLVAEGFSTIKLKIGRLPETHEIDFINEVVKMLPKRVTLRLDANRLFSLKAALAFWKRVDPARIEYIEEPLRDSTSLSEFYEQTGIPFALDETLAGHSPANFRPPAGCAAYILKPGVLGIEKTWEWTRAATSLNIRCVISSAVESGLGLTTLAHLAAAIDGGRVPVGLSTYRWFAGDLISPRFKTDQGKIDLTRYQQRFLHLQESYCGG